MRELQLAPIVVMLTPKTPLTLGVDVVVNERTSIDETEMLSNVVVVVSERVVPTENTAIVIAFGDSTPAVTFRSVTFDTDREEFDHVEMPVRVLKKNTLCTSTVLPVDLALMLVLLTPSMETTPNCDTGFEKRVAITVHELDVLAKISRCRMLRSVSDEPAKPVMPWTVLRNHAE